MKKGPIPALIRNLEDRIKRIEAWLEFIKPFIEYPPKNWGPLIELAKAKTEEIEAIRKRLSGISSRYKEHVTRKD